MTTLSLLRTLAGDAMSPPPIVPDTPPDVAEFVRIMRGG